MWSAVWRWIVGPIAGPLFGVLLIVGGIAFAVTALSQRWEISRLNNDLAAKKAEIDDPKTGWVVRNAQCETNYQTVSKALERVSGDVAQLAKDSKANNDNVAGLMKTAILGLRGVQSSTAKLLASPPSAPVGSLDACHAGAKILKGSMP